MATSNDRFRRCLSFSSVVLLGQTVSVMDTFSSLFLKLFSARGGPCIPTMQYVVTYWLICIVAFLWSILSNHKCERTKSAWRQLQTAASAPVSIHAPIPQPPQQQHQALSSSTATTTSPAEKFPTPLSALNLSSNEDNDVDDEDEDHDENHGAYQIKKEIGAAVLEFADFSQPNKLQDSPHPVNLHHNSCPSTSSTTPPSSFFSATAKRPLVSSNARQFEQLQIESPSPPRCKPHWITATVQRWRLIAAQCRAAVRLQVQGRFATRTAGFYWLLGFLDVQGGFLTVVAFNHASLASSCLIDWVSLLTTFFLCVKFRGERVTRSKILALITGLGGSLCILYSDASVLPNSGSSNGLVVPPAITEIPLPSIQPFDTSRNDFSYHEDRIRDVRQGIPIATHLRVLSEAEVPHRFPYDVIEAGITNRKSLRRRIDGVVLRSERFYGDLVCVGAAVFLGIVTVMIECALAEGAAACEVLLCSFGAAATIGLVQCLLFEHKEMWKLLVVDGVTIGYFIGAAVTMACAYSVAPLVLERCSSAFYSLSLLSSAGLAVLLSSVLLGETVHFLYLVGLLIILLSLALYHMEQK